MPQLDHDGRRYSIPGHRGSAGFRDILKWQLGGGRSKWPHEIANQSYPVPPARVTENEISATWVGHSTVLLQTAGINILTDPWFTPRASPLSFAGPKRVRAPGLPVAGLPPIDIVLVSHNHYDHLDIPTLRLIAHHHNPQVFTPLGNRRHIGKANSKLRIDEGGWGESRIFGPLRISVTPALHWSKRGFTDTNRALWGAFVIEGPAGPIYFAGDTGYGGGQHFRDLPLRFGKPRLSLLPIGAYEPRWFMAPQHMNPEEAVRAHLDLGSHLSLAIHHGTIQLTDEAIDAPALALQAAKLAGGVAEHAFLAPDIGETVHVPRPVSASPA